MLSISDSTPSLELSAHQRAELSYRALLRREGAHGDSMALVPVLEDLGTLCATDLRFGEAETCYRRALRILDTAGAESHEEWRRLNGRLVALLGAMGRHAEIDELAHAA